MRAYQIENYGAPASHPIRDLPDPVPGAGEVLVGIEAIGLNYPDALMVQGKYQKRPDPPFVPGRDCAGTVLAVGAGVEGIRPGDRVVAQVFKGAFADKVAAPLERVFPLPAGISAEDAAGAITVFNTAYVATVMRAGIKAGDRVVVTGAAGGVGLAATQLAKARGAEVVAIVSTEEKARLARDNGADHVVIPRDASEDGLKAMFKEEVRGLWPDDDGVDVVIETVGDPMFTAALRALGFGGRMIVVGFAAGKIPAAKTNYLLYNNIGVLGAPLDIQFDKAREEIRAGTAWWLGLIAEGRARANVSRKLPFERLMEGLQDLIDRKAVGKTIVALGQGAA